MKIGLVLFKTPSYSEKFLISKIKGLQRGGYKVILFANKNENFDLCEVVDMPKVSKHFSLQIIKMTLAYFTVMIQSPMTVINFLRFEKLDGKSFRHRWENLYLSSTILSKKLDWIHFCFATTAIRKENIARSINAKMSVSIRGYDINIYPLKNQNCYFPLWKRVNKVHSISYSLLEKAKKYGLKGNVEKEVIFPAVNTKIFKNKKDQVSLNSKKTIEILTVARLHWIKGLEYIIEAMGKLESVNFNYTIVGSGIEYERLVLAVNQLNLENKIKLVGYISHNDILTFYEKADLYIQYSIEEGFCNAVLEAQAMGVLTIVSDASGLSENIIDGKTGWIVPKREPTILAKQIKNIISMENIELNKIRLNAIEKVRNKFNLSQQDTHFNNFFNENLFQAK